MAWFDDKVEGTKTLAQAGKYEYPGDFPLMMIATGVTLIK
jgi:hypothetical protein